MKRFNDLGPTAKALSAIGVGYIAFNSLWAGALAGKYIEETRSDRDDSTIGSCEFPRDRVFFEEGDKALRPAINKAVDKLKADRERSQGQTALMILGSAGLLTAPTLIEAGMNTPELTGPNDVACTRANGDIGVIKDTDPEG